MGRQGGFPSPNLPVSLVQAMTSNPVIAVGLFPAVSLVDLLFPASHFVTVNSGVGGWGVGVVVLVSSWT